MFTTLLNRPHLAFPSNEFQSSYTAISVSPIDSTLNPKFSKFQPRPTQSHLISIYIKMHTRTSQTYFTSIPAIKPTPIPFHSASISCRIGLFSINSMNVTNE